MESVEKISSNISNPLSQIPHSLCSSTCICAWLGNAPNRPIATTVPMRWSSIVG